MPLTVFPSTGAFSRLSMYRGTFDPAAKYVVTYPPPPLSLFLPRTRTPQKSFAPIYVRYEKIAIFWAQHALMLLAPFFRLVVGARWMYR